MFKTLLRFLGFAVAVGVIDAATGADRWEAGAQGATQKYTQGVQNTQVDVVGRAIAQASVAAANYQAAISSGRWARKLTESGGTANWKAMTVAKASNYGTGVSAAKGKYQAAAQKLYPYIAAGQGAIHQMPSGNLGASIARATAWINYMAQYKQSS